MIKPTFKLEKELLEQGYEMIIGVDEAGRGPLAGPVVACAASYKLQITKNKFQTNFKTTNHKLKTKNWNLIRDSKMLSHKQRESLYDFIHEHFYIGVGICDHKTIDRMNILQASFLAVKKALNALSRNANYKARKIILMDGKLAIPNFSLEQRAIVGGDKIVKSISAASIVAKVTRDRIMLSMHEKYPEYHFDQHKGYGTKLHMEMLQKHGPSEIHRQSFKPVSSSRLWRDKLAKRAEK